MFKTFTKIDHKKQNIILWILQKDGLHKRPEDYLAL